MAHPGQAINESQIGGLVRQAYDRAATQQIARNGFAQTGIFPYNSNVFTEEDFAASLVSDRPDPSNDVVGQLIVSFFAMIKNFILPLKAKLANTVVYVYSCIE